MMLKLDRFDSLMKATSTMTVVSQKAALKWTPITFSLIVTHPSPNFIAGLEMSPEFFDFFDSDDIHHYSSMSIDFFFITMITMDARGFLSLNFTLVEESNQAYLRFHGKNNDPEATSLRELTLSPTAAEYVAGVDYGAFVSIDSEMFKHVVVELDSDYVSVILTDSQVKFSDGVNEIVLTKKERQCIIGGLSEENKTKFFIGLHPIPFLHDLSRQSERVWLFKSTNSSCIMVVPTGLYTEFWVYFPPM